MGFLLQIFGTLFVIVGMLILVGGMGLIHAVPASVLMVGGFLMWGQSYLIHYAKKQSSAQEKLLDIWQEFEKKRGAAG